LDKGGGGPVLSTSKKLGGQQLKPTLLVGLGKRIFWILIVDPGE